MKLLAALVVLVPALVPDVRAEARCEREWMEFDRLSAHSSLGICEELVDDLTREPPSAPVVRGAPLYIAVEGASGFAPDTRAALRSGLSSCLGFAAATGTPLRSDSVAATLDHCGAGDVAPERLKTCRKLQNYFVEGKEGLAHALLLHAFAHGELDAREVPWAYFGQGEWRDVAACARTALRAFAGARSVRLVGYSMGGFVALKTAAAMEAEGTPVEAGMSFDPVARGFGSLPSAISARDFGGMPRLETTRWWNVFQKMDKASLGIGIRGNSLPWARANVELVPGEFDGLGKKAREAERKAHVYLFAAPHVREMMKGFVESDGR